MKIGKAETMEDKTNVMRILDSKKISYKPHYYDGTGAMSGTEVAAALGEDAKRVFKTLVTQGKSKAYYVFIIPVGRELDLKKAAKAVGEKSVEMIKAKELLPLTGYVHGGCSPIGMKKYFPTTLDSTAAEGGNIFVSAGRIGAQIEILPDDLSKVIRIAMAELT